MVKLINKFTGTEMYVSNDRAVEYLAAGHKPAVEVPPAPPIQKPVTKKKATKK